MWQAAFFKKWYKSLSPEMGQDEIVPSDVKKKKKRWRHDFCEVYVQNLKGWNWETLWKIIDF